MDKKQKISLFWFRRDLRIVDNAGLYYALKEQEAVLPFFIFDTEILDKLENKEDRRVAFLHDTITQLDEDIKKENSGLLVLNTTPLEAFKQLLNEYNVQAVYTNHDYEPDAIKRDKEIGGFLKKHEIPFHTYKDQVIFEKDEVLKADKTPYTVYTPYSKIWKQSLTPFFYKPYPTAEYFKNLCKQHFGKIPSLEALGFKIADSLAPERIIHTKIIETYDKTRDYPGVEGTTRLSLHLRFGTVSIRKLVSIALEKNATWLGELIWREFFMAILYHFPHVVNHAFKAKYDDVKWRDAEADFEKWCTGMTGYPIVDAGMRQLNETGFMHNRVRMITASFLTKHLLIDWRWGESYFAEKLLDYELSSNNGNWQWVAGTGCDSAPYFRIFNPEEQTKKFDKDLEYIKTWVPEYGTDDYPKPMVDHKEARERALKAYKEAVQG